ncbi:MAG: permease-like cell division protein FtsX [Halofilum sp. (in: g-proteobacteria)]
MQEHPRAALGSLGRLWRNPGASGMTVAVIAIALALPGALWILLQNAERVGGGLETGTRISVYLGPTLENAAIDRATEAIDARDGVRIVQRITPDEALAEFRDLAGFERALESLERNPLPAVVVVEGAAGTPETAEALGALAQDLESIDGVDRARVDLAWVERLYALLALVERALTLLGVLLAVGVLLIVGNTIRLDILNRRAEIEVSKLIGGSDAFIRRPFLYGGAWYGLLGSVLACLLLALASAMLAGPAAELAAAYGSPFRFQGLGLGEAGVFLLGGTALGLGGSWLAVGRHLRSIEPG